MSTRSALAPTLSVTVVRGRVNLGVLQKISHDRGEDLSVGLDRHAVFDGHGGQYDATSVRLQCRGRCDFFDEPRNQESLPILNALRETDLRERDRLMSAREAMRLRWSTVPVLPAAFPVFNFERHDRRVEQVAQFMSQSPARSLPRAASLRGRLILFASEFSDGARDGVVKASVQCAKVVGADGRVLFDCQLGDGPHGHTSP